MSRSERPDQGSGEPVLPDGNTQQRFVEALQDLDSVVWEMDATTWTFTHVSERAERMFGYPLERWTEPGFWQEVLVDHRDRDWCTNFCMTATKHNRNHAFLYRAVTAEGRKLWLKDIVRVVADEGGEPVLLRGVMVDVTREHPTDPLPEERVLDYDDPDLEPLRRILAA